ncbi:MAG: hypothetical protein ACRCX2_24255 [Paraclostridium sp.]
MKGNIYLDKRTEEYYSKRLNFLSNGEEMRKMNSGVSEIDLLAEEILEVAKFDVDPEVTLTKDDAYKFMFRLHEKTLGEEFARLINENESLIPESICHKAKELLRKFTVIKKVFKVQ